jgi:hypothetical protein
MMPISIFIIPFLLICLAFAFAPFGGGRFWYFLFESFSDASGGLFVLSIIALAVFHKKDLIAITADANVVASGILELARRDQPLPKYSLYLRPFKSTGHTTVRPRYFYSHPLGGEDDLPAVELESALVYAFRKMYPLVALGHSKETLLMGAPRVYADDDEWWTDFILLAKGAAFIVITPGPDESVIREITWLKKNTHIHKCIFVMPPHSYERAWDWAAVKLALVGLTIPPYNVKGAIFLLGRTSKVKSLAVLDITVASSPEDIIATRLKELGISSDGKDTGPLPVPKAKLKRPCRPVEATSHKISVEDNVVVVTENGGRWKLYIGSDLRDASYAPFPDSLATDWNTILRTSIVCNDGKKKDIEFQMNSCVFKSYLRCRLGGKVIKKWRWPVKVGKFKTFAEDNVVVVTESGGRWELYTDSDLRDASYDPIADYTNRTDWNTILRTSIVCHDGKKKGIEFQMARTPLRMRFRCKFDGEVIREW